MRPDRNRMIEGLWGLAWECDRTTAGVRNAGTLWVDRYDPSTTTMTLVKKEKTYPHHERG